MGLVKPVPRTPRPSPPVGEGFSSQTPPKGWCPNPGGSGVYSPNIVGTWNGKPISRTEFLELMEKSEAERLNAIKMDKHGWETQERWKDYASLSPEMRSEVCARARNPHPDPIIGDMDRALGEADKLISNFDRFYTSERVWHEQVGTGDGKTTRFNGKLAWTPVKPKDDFGQAGIEFTSKGKRRELVGEDRDGSGVLRGDVSAESHIAHNTGCFIIDFMTAPAKGEPIYANYWFDMVSDGMSPETTIPKDSRGWMEKRAAKDRLTLKLMVPPPEYEPASKPGYFCKYCGSAYRDDDDECRKCGAPRVTEKDVTLYRDGTSLECGSCGERLESPRDECSCRTGRPSVPQVSPVTVEREGGRPRAAAGSIVHKGGSGGWGLGKTLFTLFTVVTGVVSVLAYVETFFVPVL